MTRIEKDLKESQMWSDSVKPKLRWPAASCHPGVPRGLPEALAAITYKGRFPGVEARVLPLRLIRKLFGQRNK